MNLEVNPLRAFIRIYLVSPLSADQSEVTHHFIVRKGTDRSEIEGWWGNLDLIMREEIEILEKHVQRGIRMGIQAGRYNEPRNGTLIRYRQLVARSLLPPDRRIYGSSEPIHRG